MVNKIFEERYAVNIYFVIYHIFECNIYVERQCRGKL